jgi:cyclase
MDPQLKVSAQPGSSPKSTFQPAIWPENQEISMRQISPHVYVETEYIGSNVGCIKTANGKVMIDCPVLPAEIDNLKRELVEIDNRDVAYSIITDHHYDHSYSTFLFCRHVVSHKSAFKGMQYIQNLNNLLNLIEHDLPVEYAENRIFFLNAKVALPEIMFHQELTLNLGDCTVELKHRGGHSAATISIYVPQDKVLFTGDNFENLNYPFTGEARFASLIQALIDFESSEAEILVPGHGEICGKGPLRQLRSFFEFMRERGKELKREEGDIKRIGPKVIEEIRKYEVYKWKAPPRMKMDEQIIRDMRRMWDEMDKGLL